MTTNTTAPPSCHLWRGPGNEVTKTCTALLVVCGGMGRTSEMSTTHWGWDAHGHPMDCYQRGRGAYMHHLRLKVHSICRENIKEGKRKKRPGSVRFQTWAFWMVWSICLTNWLTGALGFGQRIDIAIHRHLLMIYTQEQKTGKTQEHSSHERCQVDTTWT